MDLAAGRLLPAGSEREGKSLRLSALPAWVGAVAATRGAFLETLSKYSQRTGAFLEMRGDDVSLDPWGQTGVLQTGGGGGQWERGDIPHLAGRRQEEGVRAGLHPGGAQDSSKRAPGILQVGVSGCPNGDTST